MAVNWRAWLSRTVTAVFFLAGAYLLVRLTQEIGVATLLSTLRDQPLLNLLGLFLLPLPALLISTVRSRVILAGLKTRVSTWPLFGIILGANSVGYLVPGGEISELSVRALLFGRAGLATKEAILSTLIEGFLRFGVNSVLLFVVGAYFFLTRVSDPMAREAVSLGGLVSLIGLLIFFFVVLTGLGAWFIRTAHKISQSREVEALNEESEEFLAFFKKIDGPVLWATLLTAFGFAWEPIQFGLVLRFLGFDLPFWQVFWLYQSLVLPRLIPVPAGLGVVEGGGVLFTEFVGKGGALGFLASLLWRVRLLPYLLLGLLLLPFIGYLKLKPRPT